MKKNEMTFRIKPANPGSEDIFDFENWLVELLVDYLQREGDGGNDCYPPFLGNDRPEGNFEQPI
ncbi:MAG: hypothetical protein AB1746_10200 [Candidatus Zixiibacteriota bacterium]